jgi:sugar/nucleoside kinase (ribokinase family)
MSREGAVVAGHICLDIIPRIPGGNVQARLTPGALIEIGAALLSTGGPVSNTGRSLHTLGIATRLMGKVGDDPFGRIILDLIRAQDPALARHMIVVPGEVSSYSIVLSPPDADRSFLHCAGANHTFSAADVDYESLRRTRLFHFGYPPIMERMYADDGAELEVMFRRARESGVITSLDMAMPDLQGPSGRVDWRRILQRVLPQVDIFLPSLDELLVMLRHDLPASPEAADALLPDVAADMLGWGARIVVLKLGARGLYLRIGSRGVAALPGAGWRERELRVSCFVPEPHVGTTGAGDATIAGFLAGVLRGQPVEAALTSAVAVGACNVEAADALSGIRPWAETQARIAAGWARLPVTVGAPGWVWSGQYALWAGSHDAVLGQRA